MFLWLLFDYQIHLVIKWDLFPPGCCACAQRRWGHFCRGSGCTPCCEMSAQGYSSSVRWGRRALAGALKEAASNRQTQGALWAAAEGRFLSLFPEPGQLLTTFDLVEAKWPLPVYAISLINHSTLYMQFTATHKCKLWKRGPNVQWWHLEPFGHDYIFWNITALDKIKLKKKDNRK